MTFWGIWDRERRRLWERTRRDLPGRRRQVAMRGRSVRVRAGSIEFDLEFDQGVSDRVHVPERRGRLLLDAQGGRDAGPRRGPDRPEEQPAQRPRREDDSAGYHRRYTSWKWSAGVGTARDGRKLAWNLVSGINDPPSSSERAIWVAGEPTEPGPVEFQGLESIHFEDESRLNFTAETERTHHEGIPLLARSDYEAPFGTLQLAP